MISKSEPRVIHALNTRGLHALIQNILGINNLEFGTVPDPPLFELQSFFGIEDSGSESDIGLCN